jgi:2-dehydro-3-deoxyglucarate aldolase
MAQHAFNHGRSLLKENLSARHFTLGSWVTIPHPTVVELMALGGFEWIVVDREHAAIGHQAMLNLIAHGQGNGMEVLVRVGQNEEIEIKRAMDCGAQGVIVPMIKSKAEAESAVRFTKYPTAGARGVGLSRAQHYGIGFESYQQWLADESVIIVQIEHIDAVDQLEQILTVPGIDGAIVGPYDLSGSLGLPGRFDAPEVVRALQLVEEIAAELGKPLGFHFVKADAEAALATLRRGYSFLAFGLDFTFLGEKIAEEVKNLRSGLDA